jgi:beta-phosphoglucomutase-like phosphatase (HAD superfamily)
MESIDVSHNGGPGAVLWDLDGTLIDSAGLHWFAWHEVMAEEGHSITPRQFADSFGKRNDTILRGLLGPDLADGWIRRVSDAKEERYRRYVRERGLEFLPGAATWLARLRETGWKQVLASSAPPANIDSALEALDLGRWLDGLVSAEEVGIGKPDPAIFLRAAERVARLPPAASWTPAGLRGAPGGDEKRGRALVALSELVSMWLPSLEALPPRLQTALKEARAPRPTVPAV